MSRERLFHWIGWGLFVLCAILYTIDSLRVRNWLGLAGSLAFLIACIFFILPLTWQDR